MAPKRRRRHSTRRTGSTRPATCAPARSTRSTWRACSRSAPFCKRQGRPKESSKGSGEAGALAPASLVPFDTVSTPATIEDVERRLRERRYIGDRSLATSIFLALKLQKPLFIEGEAGVGKTEAAKVMAEVLGARLTRLQCYEGIDLAHAVYEWNYPRQLLHIRLMGRRGPPRRRARDLQLGVSAPPPAARRHRQRRRDAAGAPDRRDRPLRRGVRGFPARAALRLPDFHPGDRDHQGPPGAVRRDHIQPYARGARRAEAPLPLPLDRLPRPRQGGRDRPRARARGGGRPGPRGRGPRPGPARDGPLQGAWGGGDPRLGAVARRAGRDADRPKPRQRDHGRGAEVPGGPGAGARAGASPGREGAACMRGLGSTSSRVSAPSRDCSTTPDWRPVRVA